MCVLLFLHACLLNPSACVCQPVLTPPTADPCGFVVNDTTTGSTDCHPKDTLCISTRSAMVLDTKKGQNSCWVSEPFSG